jgi:NlpC/P60 family putative phage cell wall peptidase
MSEAEQRLRVVEVAKTWLNTPYHHRAMVKGAGTDCGMSLIGIFSEAGVIEPFDPEPYPPDWMLHRGEERYLGIVERFAKPVDSCKPGDIALFKFGHCISHGGIVADWPMIIHAYRDAGCVTIDDVTANARLRKHFVGFWSCWPDEGK